MSQDVYRMMQDIPHAKRQMIEQQEHVVRVQNEIQDAMNIRNRYLTEATGMLNQVQGITAGKKQKIEMPRRRRPMKQTGRERMESFVDVDRDTQSLQGLPIARHGIALTSPDLAEQTFKKIVGDDALLANHFIQNQDERIGRMYDIDKLAGDHLRVFMANMSNKLHMAYKPRTKGFRLCNVF